MQWVMCQTADQGVASSIPAWFHTFAKIDHEIISTAISSLPLIQEGLLSNSSESIYSEVLVNGYIKLAKEISVIG